jgi:conjugative transfer signal peptidase TraF
MTTRQTVTVCVIAGAVLGSLAVAHGAGLRVNTTSSVPIGLWEIAAGRMRPARGDVVAVCLPAEPARQAEERNYVAAGDCPDGVEPLVKPVAAIGGDLVVVSTGGITVNGVSVANTVPLTQDEAGRALRSVMPGSYRVAPAELWLASGHNPRSFDSRYFGAVPIANVLGVARPLWVFP